MQLTLPEDLTTITQHIAIEEDLHPEATGDFTNILHNLALAIRIISRDVRRAGLNDILGLTRSTNIHGEQVRRLDIYSNEVIKRTMMTSGGICVMASEEDDDIILVDDKKNRGKYVLLFDPLDGSSNIDVNVTIGTIFSLYRRLNPKSEENASLQDVLQPGYKQVSAGYILYGSSTVFVYTTGHGVNMFTYDPGIGEFLLTRKNVQIPNRGNYYSCNEGNYYKWDDNIRQYIDYLKTPSTDKVRPYSHRYIGTAVADVHRTLLKGGIFLYPPDISSPKGKLRLMYEANALALVVEQAGGRATDGHRRILELKPEQIHQRTPLFVGSKEDIFDCELFIKNEHPHQQFV